MRIAFQPARCLAPWILIVGLTACAARPTVTLHCHHLDLLEDCLRESDFSGAIIVTRGNNTLIEDGFGMADSARSNTTRTRFRIGSLSKTLTAVGVLRALAETDMTTSTTLAGSGVEVPHADAISLDHLLRHRAGLPQLTRADFERWQATDVPAATIVAALQARSPRRQPGVTAEYSNEGYLVLGHWLETVTGEPLHDAMTRLVFDPAGMEQTGYEAFDRGVSGLAQGHPSRPDDAAQSYAIAHAAGGYFSTAADITAFLDALAGTLLSAEQRRAMFTPLPDDEFGYGWVVGKRFGREVYFHNGSVPGFFSFVAWFPGDDVRIIALSNRELALGPLVRTIASLVFEG